MVLNKNGNIDCACGGEIEKVISDDDYSVWQCSNCEKLGILDETTNEFIWYRRIH